MEKGREREGERGGGGGGENRRREKGERVGVEPPVHPAPGLAAANMPPKAQPWTRSVSEPFSAIVESRCCRCWDRNPAAPFVLAGPHVDQHLFAVLVRFESTE